MKLIVLFFVSVTAFAETNIIQSISIDGRTFTNATIRKVNPTTAIVRDENGFGSIAITNLPEPFRSKFYDTNEISELLKKEAKARESEAAVGRAMATAERKRLFVVIDSRLVPKSKLEELDIEISEVDGDGELGTVYWHTDVRQYGPHIGENGIKVGSQLHYGHEVFAKGAKGGSVGRKVRLKAMRKGTITKNGQVVELWDCGTEPK